MLGLTVLANLTGRSRAKSLAMVALGLVLSTVGMDPLGGTVRFTFDVAGAQGGLSFIAVATGLFGVAEVLAAVAQPGSRCRPRASGSVSSIRAARRCGGRCRRCSGGASSASSWA